MELVTARKLWESGTFLGDCATAFVLNCKQINMNGPRLAWLVPVGGCCGLTGQYQLTMQNPNPGNDGANNAAGIIQGVWVEGVNGSGGGALYDALTVAEITDACNACCDASGAVTVVAPKYNGTFPDVADVTPTLFTFTRADNGGVLDMQRFMLDYLGQYVEGTVIRTAYSGGNSTYTFTAKDDPSKIGTDTYVETARTFDSNSVAAGGAGNHYTLQVVSDGTTQTLLDDDAYNTIALLVTAAQADGTLGALGTWIAQSASVIRLSSTSVKTATLTITNVAD